MIKKDWSLELKHISFLRNKHKILDDVSLQISSNDFILMTGQNGSGKSTLLKIISGLLKPAMMEVNSGTKKKSDLLKHSWFQARNMLRQRVCYLHQEPYLFNGTVFDNIAYGLRRKKSSRKEINLQVKKALQVFSLDNLTYRDCRELSGGEKQRVAIVRSWIIRPDIMLLDEPFANMDKESRLKSYQLINQLQQNNIAVILTSHDPQSGALDFNQHLHLYHGEMVQKSIS